MPSHYVIATFQLYGSSMLTVPDYFFRVREIGRLRQTRYEASLSHSGTLQGVWARD